MRRYGKQNLMGLFFLTGLLFVTVAVSGCTSGFQNSGTKAQTAGNAGAGDQNSAGKVVSNGVLSAGSLGSGAVGSGVTGSGIAHGSGATGSGVLSPGALWHGSASYGAGNTRPAQQMVKDFAATIAGSDGTVQDIAGHEQMETHMILGLNK